MKSSAVEEYLETIYKLESESGSVRQTQLAEYLELTAPSVAEMVKKMIGLKLITRDKKASLKLTRKGKKAALSLIRKHRLSERFLTDVLGLPWDKAHEEACKLEHVISPEVEDGLDRLLDNPKSCPHGHSIPDKEGAVVGQGRTRPLSELEADKAAVIVNVSEKDPKMLKYLATLGLLPDIEVVIEEIGPFNGPLLIKVGSAKYAIGREVASQIMVRSV